MKTVLVAVSLLLALGWARVGQAGPANVIVILADDQGWGDLSLHGNPNLQTPNIDSLARDGAQVEHFYVSAVCSPTRAEFLTGRYHGRMGVSGTSVGRERFSADEQTIANVFRDHGYATAVYGKWHSGMQWPYHPNARGFDDFYGFCSGHWANYFSPMLERNGAIVQGNGFLTDDLTDRAIEFVDTHRTRPFFLFLPYNTPHSPMQVPDEYWNRFKDKVLQPDPVPGNANRQNLEHTRAALAMCENIDANVGRLLNHLEKTQLSEQTIVVYFSDNGPNGFRYNGGMRGRKGSTYEGGLRSPCLIRYPAKIRAGTRVTNVAAAIDLLPTLSELAGLDVNAPLPLDGRSFAPSLLGKKSASSDRFIISTWKQRASVRSQRWRMQRSGELYDIKNDPRETSNVADQHPAVVKSLKQHLDDYLAVANLAPAERPFSVGHPEARFTQLPARDAIPKGGVKRNNRFPNCTYMTNWRSTSDAIIWNVDVMADGLFEVQVYYASASIGSVIELRFANQRIATTISEANVAREIGMQNDRFPRQEGYTKSWRPMTLGTIQLTKGTGTLTLRASEIVGDQVADMRLLMLRRVE